MIRYGKMLLVIIPFMLCGCLEVSQQIFVNKDGSGKIVERFLMSKAALKQLNDVFSSLPSAKGSKSEPMNAYDEEKLKEGAAAYGPGVSYVSSKRASTKRMTGYEAVYAFNDITALRINQNPSGKSPAASDSPRKEDQENITFQFDKGSSAQLTVLFPKKAKAPKEKKRTKDTRDEKAKQQEVDELRELLGDFYIGITLHPEGRIVETNATYNDNGTITLLEMDFKKLITNENQFQSFIKKEPATIEEAKALIKNLPGFKVELNDRVEIAFQ